MTPEIFYGRDVELEPLLYISHEKGILQSYISH